MRDYTDKVGYSIYDEKGKVTLRMFSQHYSFNRELSFSSMSALKKALENELILFIADAEDLFPKRQEPKEQTDAIAMY